MAWLVDFRWREPIGIYDKVCQILRVKYRIISKVNLIFLFIWRVKLFLFPLMWLAQSFFCHYWSVSWKRRTKERKKGTIRVIPIHHCWFSSPIIIIITLIMIIIISNNSYGRSVPALLRIFTVLFLHPAIIYPRKGAYFRSYRDLNEEYSQPSADREY